jgi:hypothetical protein
MRGEARIRGYGLARLRAAAVPQPLIARMMGGNATRQFALPPLDEPA